MRVAMLTREFPPDVYGGAGVHVDFLVRELARLIDVDVHCMGEPRQGATAHSEDDARMPNANAARRILSTDLTMTPASAGLGLAHSPTWYGNRAGHWAKLLHDVPHVVTAHSLEPRRPWKAEQLGGGYRLSSWAERTAYLAADAVIAGRHRMRADVLDAYPDLAPARVHVVGNGVDAEAYRPVHDPDTVRALGVDPDRPYALFVGRITRQKGVTHLLKAAEQLPPEAGLVLCAGAAAPPAERQQVADAVAELQARRSGVGWVGGRL